MAAWKAAVIVMVLLSVCSGCAENHQLHPYNEVVLSPGEKVVAKNKNGEFSIAYVDELRRKFTWNGQSKTIDMIPRTERFLGGLGIYNPAARGLGLGGDGVRVVAQEEQMHFDSKEEAQAWLVQSSDVMDWVYTDDGLVAGFGRTPSRNQVNIDLFRIYVDGKPPEQLEGARPQDIRKIDAKE